MTDWPLQTGEIAGRIRSHDWSSTPLGPIATWPAALRRAAEITLGAPMASVLLWGPEYIVTAYNEGYRIILGDKPDVFGQPVLEVWAEERALLEPQLARVLNGETLLFRELPMSLWRGAVSDESWFDYGYGPVRDDSGAVAGMIASVLEVTDRVLAQRALRKSEERQAFLLRLGDTLRVLADPDEVMEAASEALGRHLAVGRCGYGEVDQTGEYFIVERDWTDGVMPSFVGRHLFVGFGPELVEAYRAGRSVLIDDALADARAAGHEAAFEAAGGVRASLGVPLIKDGRFVAGLFVQQISVRRWSAEDEALAREVVERTWEAVARAHAESTLRESEERQAFLLTLSDALRPLADGAEIQRETTRLLGEHLGVDRCYYFETDHQTSEYVIRRDFARGNLRSLVGRHPLQQWPEMTAALTRGETLIVDNYADSPDIPPEERAPTENLDIRAIVLIPLVKQGSLVACMAVIQAAPRNWASGEVALVADVAERTWAAVERGRAEESVVESEERFAQFANASSGGLWIRDATNLVMEYTSRSISSIYDVDTETILGEVENWARMIVPEDRASALEHLERARQGESVSHEFRIQHPSDGTFRWIRDTAFPLHSNKDAHVQRIGGIAEDVTEEKLTAEHQGVLLAELQHRVRNIMAIIRSIVTRTARGADNVEHYSELLSGRLLTLARVQALLTRAANAGVDIVTIVKDELTAQATHADQFDASGPEVLLSAKAAETMTLAVHELTTNALKYGALSVPEGKITVRWTVEEKRGTPWLTFDWKETGTPARPAASGPRRVGFGSELIEGRIPYELRGRGRVTIDPGGAQCHLDFPLQAGTSVLETDAPKRVEVFGGAIDMTGAADLSGQRILVVEDDYYLANDTARALKAAGADVIGPYPSEDSARDAMSHQPLNAAVLDINLNGGRSFELARELSNQGVPFVFVTGYDKEVIPTEFEAVSRLQKPVEFRRIVNTLADSLLIER